MSGSVLSALKRSREAFLDRHADARDWASRLYSGSTLALWRAAAPAMREHCRGVVLDAGSGRSSWRGLVLESATTYECIDLAPRGGARPTWVGDVMHMPQVPAERYDTVVCHQVLEHLPRPWDALAEFARVLRPGGRLIVSVPHLSRLHELPHDYFRFTPAGLRELLLERGFAIERLDTYGGLCAFVHHQLSTVLPGAVAGVPVLGAACLALNAPFAWLAAAVDATLDRGRLLPNGVVAVAVRAARK